MSKKLGILGGMGPEATASLFERIVKKTPAKSDQEHIDITIFNDPSIPDRTSFLLGCEGAEDFTVPLKIKIKQLEELGCEVIAIPCSTSHVRYNSIASTLTKATLLHMPRIAAHAAKRLGAISAGILATDGTIQFELYQNALLEANIHPSIPSQETQEQVMEIIYSYVKAGKTVPEELKANVLSELQKKGCDSVILGCTELSVIGLPKKWGNLNVIDALDELAQACVDACTQA